MWQVAGSVVDAIHALLMVAWVAGLPLLFWRKHHRLSRAYAVFALTFVVLYQTSRLVLGQCFLTIIERWLWEHPSSSGASLPPSDEWFTVRLARAVMHFTPTHQSIVWISHALVVVTAVGMLWSLNHEARARADRRRRARG